jgi:phage protein D
MGGELRQPRGSVRVNGQAMPGWIWFETDANEFSSPDEFRCAFAISELPADRGVDWWASQTDLECEFFAGLVDDGNDPDGEQLVSIFFGKADDLAVGYGEKTIELRGRDLTSAFVDNKTSEKYVNATSSRIATQLAAKYGLSAQVTATTTRVGVYYTLDHVDLKSDRTEWDLLTWLARQEGFRVFVKGKTLHFEPPPAATEPYVLERVEGDENGPDAWNGQGVQLSRTLTVARDITVLVTSWNHKQKKTFTRFASRAHGVHGAHAQKYSYRIGGLSPEQAQQRAQKLLDEISRHEMKLAFSGPADTSLAIDSVIAVRGTGTDFDQTYYPESITRRLSRDDGFSWDVRAKNHSPESEANL